jgi:hypothetical protein
LRFPLPWPCRDVTWPRRRTDESPDPAAPATPAHLRTRTVCEPMLGVVSPRSRPTRSAGPSSTPRRLAAHQQRPQRGPRSSSSCYRQPRAATRRAPGPREGSSSPRQRPDRGTRLAQLLSMAANHGVAFSSDGRWMATGNGNTARVWSSRAAPSSSRSNISIRFEASRLARTGAGWPPPAGTRRRASGSSPDGRQLVIGHHRVAPRSGPRPVRTDRSRPAHRPQAARHRLGDG